MSDDEQIVHLEDLTLVFPEVVTKTPFTLPETKTLRLEFKSSETSEPLWVSLFGDSTPENDPDSWEAIDPSDPDYDAEYRAWRFKGKS